MKYVLGADFGTQSARTVVAEVETGNILSYVSMEYEHGVQSESLPSGVLLSKGAALAHPADYIEALIWTVKQAVKESGINPSNIIGISVDATSCSLIPVKSDGTPLCMYEEWENNPHAYIKLWKHHSAQKDNIRLTEIAQERGEGFLGRCGFKPSCEWVFPKIMETLRESPDVYLAADYFMDICDWLTLILSGNLCRSWGSTGYKAFWSPSHGYPPNEFFEALHPLMYDVVQQKLAGTILPPGSSAGTLTADMARWMGIPEGIAVAIGSLDGHSPLPTLGLNRPGDALLVIGTSTVIAVLSDKYAEISGICGVVKGGMHPGLYGYDSGQNCVGDLLAWFVEYCVPISYYIELEQRGISIYQFLAEKASKKYPGESGLVALDWWNGNRSILADMDLTGSIFGLTLQTKPEDIYRALVEATAFGAKRILEEYEKYGIKIDRIAACGGIAAKNKYMMQLYSDILGRDLLVSGIPNAAAMGSAIYAACAAGKKAGGYDSPDDAIKNMAHTDYTVYSPNREHTQAYKNLYSKYKYLHDLLGKQISD